MGPVAVGECGGAELSKDGGGVGGGGRGGEGGALDLRHVGHHVVGCRAHHRDTLVSVLHLMGMKLKKSSQHNFNLKVAGELNDKGFAARVDREERAAMGREGTHVDHSSLSSGHLVLNVFRSCYLNQLFCRF